MEIDGRPTATPVTHYGDLSPGHGSSHPSEVTTAPHVAMLER